MSDSTSNPSDLPNGPDLGEFRMTRQRREVFDALMSRRDHPSATEIFVQVKERMPSISLATVYNCLETMTHCGVVRQVNLDRESSRYCANLEEHAHFCCQECGQVSDVDLKSREKVTGAFALPDGSEVDRYDVMIRGTCPACNARRAESASV